MSIKLVKDRLRPLYRRSKVLRALYRAYLLPGQIKLARMERLPFNGDTIVRQLVDFMLADQITQFVETGTYLGYTTRYLASMHLALPIITIEYNELFYRASQTTLGLLPNVTQLLGDSGVVLQRLVEQKQIAGLPMIFLDAHWGTMPLSAELRILSSSLQDAVVLIHDFQVPGREDYGFDTYAGRAIGMEMLREGIAPNRSCALFLPQYTFQDAFPRPTGETQLLRGQALLFIGAAEVLARFCASEYARYYVKISDCHPYP